MWPCLVDRECNWSKECREVEPGEIDEFHFDFVIPAHVQLVEIYSYIRNVKKQDREIGWNTTTVYSLCEDTNMAKSGTQFRTGQGPPKKTPPKPTPSKKG
jgi:hypothetical protein